ncbi:MAG TPA: ABC transporter ATP-binding protein [Pseudobacteroides sp.]|uniref:ABC transporter ATP-binding protein n=1 Tax=Pseudobacteroides sp. TaxID=1968840 RepID=UPI002F9587B7
MDPVVTLDSISKSYSKRMVLDNVSLSIENGQIYGLIGPSGAGKTTLVKIMVGMEKTDVGTAHVLDRKMPNLEVMQNIGYMAQSDALYSELTGEENLKFFASLFKINKSDQKKRIAYVAELANLTDHLKKKVSAYSGGMKRRLSLGIALIQNPSVLILDEPTVGIDPELRLGIWNELYRLKNSEGKTIIITTHVMDEALKCDVLAMIRDGKVLTKGTPKALMESYNVINLEDVFIKAGGKLS